MAQPNLDSSVHVSLKSTASLGWLTQIALGALGHSFHTLLNHTLPGLLLSFGSSVTDNLVSVTHCISQGLVLSADKPAWNFLVWPVHLRKHG